MERRAGERPAAFQDPHGESIAGGLEGEPQCGGRGFACRGGGPENGDEGMARLGRDREAAQFLVARMAQPRDERVARPGAQHLLRRPERIEAAGRAHDGELREIDAGGGERRRIRQVRRGEPHDALALLRQRGERRQDDLQLAYTLCVAQDLGERPARPPAARQLRIELAISR